MKPNKYILLLFLVIFSLQNFAQEASPIVLVDKNLSQLSGNVFYYKDPTGNQTINEVKNQEFLPYNGEVVNMGVTNDIVWLKVDVKNLLDRPWLYFMVAQPNCSLVELYGFSNGQQSDHIKLGRFTIFTNRPILNPNYIFPVDIERKSIKQFYLKISSTNPIQVPMFIGQKFSVLEMAGFQSMVFGMYAGLVVIMIFYNLFIFFSVRDWSYIYYILFIFFVGLTQTMLKGYGFQYLWPNNLFMAKYDSIIIPVLSGVTTGLFVKQFLQLKKLKPFHNIRVNIFIAIYLIIGLVGVFVNKLIGVQLLNTIAFVGSGYVLFLGIVVMKKGLKQGKYFTLAFSVFLSAVILFVLCNINILPFNSFTSNILEMGSSIQILLLAFALADKINTYRNEQMNAKQEALRISEEHMGFIKNHNIILEKEVAKRTNDLELANDNLSALLDKLKSTQTKLVESEKMASLGQLTAGIAHEINNPINFVVSNVKPLELDVNDLIEIIKRYEGLNPNQNIEAQIKEINSFKNQIDFEYIKKEITDLLLGIKDGANRTAEIVSNLKNFARVDQANVKLVNLNEGIESTLNLLKNTYPNNFELNKLLDDIPMVECMPGKINQVFMNIITNAIQSVTEKQKRTGEKAILTIKTIPEADVVKVSIKDNGTGIPNHVIEKIYEPFYTTKPVGKGTGLGMSIVKGIIDNHHGQIEINSKIGEGAEFIISLPIRFSAQT